MRLYILIAMTSYDKHESELVLVRRRRDVYETLHFTMVPATIRPLAIRWWFPLLLNIKKKRNGEKVAIFQEHRKLMTRSRSSNKI